MNALRKIVLYRSEADSLGLMTGQVVPGSPGSAERVQVVVLPDREPFDDMAQRQAARMGGTSAPPPCEPDCLLVTDYGSPSYLDFKAGPGWRKGSPFTISGDPDFGKGATDVKFGGPLVRKNLEPPPGLRDSALDRPVRIVLLGCGLPDRLRGRHSGIACGQERFSVAEFYMLPSIGGFIRFRLKRVVAADHFGPTEAEYVPDGPEMERAAELLGAAERRRRERSLSRQLQAAWPSESRS